MTVKSVSFFCSVVERCIVCFCYILGTSCLSEIVDGPSRLGVSSKEFLRARSEIGNKKQKKQNKTERKESNNL